MKRTTAYYVRHGNVITDSIPRIPGDPKYRDQLRIVGYDYHVEQVRKARAAGLSAARDAVAALPRWGNESSDLAAALAAIDALRGESNE